MAVWGQWPAALVAHSQLPEKNCWPILRQGTWPWPFANKVTKDTRYLFEFRKQNGETGRGERKEKKRKKGGECRFGSNYKTKMKVRDKMKVP
jgi:hypothetical protein